MCQPHFNPVSPGRAGWGHVHGAVLCHAAPRHAPLRCATVHCAVPCHAEPCRAVLCRAVPRFAMWCHAAPCHAVPRGAVPCRAVPRGRLLSPHRPPCAGAGSWLCLLEALHIPVLGSLAFETSPGTEAVGSCNKQPKGSDDARAQHRVPASGGPGRGAAPLLLSPNRADRGGPATVLRCWGSRSGKGQLLAGRGDS